MFSPANTFHYTEYTFAYISQRYTDVGISNGIGPNANGIDKCISIGKNLTA